MKFLLPVPSILIVDDEEGIRVALGNLFSAEGYSVERASNRPQAISAVRTGAISAVLLDIRLGNDDGIEVLREIKKIAPDVIVIMITGHGSIDSSVQAMKCGASDYILKPLDNTTVLEAVRKNLELIALRNENDYLKSEIRQTLDIRQIKTSNPDFLNVLSIADRVKNTPASVLITGESGSGKELLARYIHFTSNRRDKNFVGVNCAALSESLLLSELFGHEKGAFTGAVEQRSGKFEMAHQGTLFLDEIGDMTPEIQAKILRVMEERSFERVGGIRPIRVDVRVVAATNRNLERLIQEGRFRNDLYYRLKVITCELPPLRNRVEDIPILIDEFIEFYNDRYAKKVRSMHPDLVDKLKRHQWPGNIRELRNLVNQAVLLCEGESIETLNPGTFSTALIKNTADVNWPPQGSPLTLKEARSRFSGELEARIISDALLRNRGNKTKTAEELGISRKTLFRKILFYRL